MIYVAHVTHVMKKGKELKGFTDVDIRLGLHFCAKDIYLLFPFFPFLHIAWDSAI